MSSSRPQDSRLWSEIRAAFEPHRGGDDRDAIAALNRVSVKCLGLDRAIQLGPETSTASEVLLSPAELGKLVRYHERARPLRSHDPIIVVVWNGRRFVVDGNTRVNMWVQSGDSVHHRAIVIEPESRGAA